MPDQLQTDLIEVASNIFRPMPISGTFSPVPRVHFSKYGMEISGEDVLPFEDWMNAGRSLRDLREQSEMAFMWSWGDWITYGQTAYGEKYSQGMAVTGLAYQTLANYKWTASKTPKEIRGLPGLTQRHYIAVAKIDDYTLKTMLLIQASEKKWTATGDLPKAIERELNGEVVPEQAQLPPPPDPLYEDEDKGDSNVTQFWGDPNASWQNDSESDFDRPPPATQADQIDTLQFENNSLEKRSAEWFLRYGWLENQIKQAVTQLHILDEMIVGRSTERECLDEALEALEATKPAEGSFALIMAVLEAYQKGNTSAMIDTLDALVELHRG